MYINITIIIVYIYNIIMYIYIYTGWWFLATPLKNDGLRQLRDDNRNPLYSWENKIDGNQTTNHPL